ncbi:unnamed protein product [Cochlearia groenlandica]
MGSPILLCDGQFLTGEVSSAEEDDGALFSGDGAQEEEEEEEWCGDNRLCFYFVKQYAYDDPEIKEKINEADQEIYHCNNVRINIANSLKAKRVERLCLDAPMENFEGYNSISTNKYIDMEVETEQEVVIEEVNRTSSERFKEIKTEIELLDARMSRVLDQRDRAFERIKFLRIQRDKGNAAFYQSCVVMKKAVKLASSGNVRELEELANSEVDKFMSCWSTDKAFRDDYKKRILPSLEQRKLMHDGRIKDLEGNAIELKRFSTDEEEERDDDDDMVYEKLIKEEEEEEEIDEENLKEKKREEQIEKAKLAMERKKKLHEKAAAKAAIRVKKEAEKKLKELEKRAMKKKAASSNSSSPFEVEKTAKQKQVNGRSVNTKQRSFRYKHHKKGNEDVPKAILKRRKAYKLWVWSVSSAAVAIFLALLIMFFYFR